MSEREAREIVDKWTHETNRGERIRDLAAALDARVEACCRAVCPYCARGLVAVETKGHSVWYHAEGSNRFAFYCVGSPIRDAFSKEEG